MNSLILGLNMDAHAEGDGALDRIQIRADYVRAIFAAGCLPLLIPAEPRNEALRSYLTLLDGMILSGGADYPPEIYGAASHPETKPCAPMRAQTDPMLASLLFSETRCPVLGICLGHQLISMAHGGKLIQHLPTAEQHKSVRPGLDREHRVHLVPGSWLYTLFGAETIVVNSAHHQGLDPATVPATLSVAAWDDDGLVEAVEGRDANRFILGVQWHPERIRDAEHRRRLFSAFADVCRQGADDKEVGREG